MNQKFVTKTFEVSWHRQPVKRKTKGKKSIKSLDLPLKDKKLFYITAKYYVPIILSKIIPLIKQHFTLFYAICIPNDQERQKKINLFRIPINLNMKNLTGAGCHLYRVSQYFTHDKSTW